MTLLSSRGQALEYMRLVLFDQPYSGLICVVFTGRRHKPTRFVWPEDHAGRLVVFGHVRRLLLSCESSGEVRTKQDGARRGQVVVMQWPAAQADLSFLGEEGQQPAPEPQEKGEACRSRPLVKRPGGADARASEECARHVLRLLYEGQKRLTGDALCEAMSTSTEVYPWSKRSVEHALSWLRGIGVVDNAGDGRGRGYGLIDWSVDPNAGAE